jgi:hypothetical protein
MLVKITDSPQNIRELIAFLQQFPLDTYIGDIEFEFNVQWHTTVSFYAPRVEKIECGDHVPGEAGQYPLDLLVSLHSHETD